MGSSNNLHVRKPGGAKSLAAEYLKNQPKGASWERCSLSLSPAQTLHAKKIKSGARVKAGARG